MRRARQSLSVRFDLGKLFWLVQRERVVALLLSAAACNIQPPSGRIVCQVHEDCPPGFFCSQLSSEVKRCTPQLWDAQVVSDGSTADAGFDAAVSGNDAGVMAMDAGPHDAGLPGRTDTSPPKPPPDARQPEPDTGREEPEPPTGNEMIPPFIEMPLPACGGEPDASKAYFVSAGVGEDVANCGGPQGPCRSIHKALQRAVDDGVTFVYLDNTDVYVESEPLRLPAGVVLAGGFSNVNGRWTRLCDAARGKTRLTSSGNPVVLAEYAGASKLAALTIETRVANAGESMLGVLARGADTKLWLQDVTVLAADGGAGAVGAAGTPGAPVSASCEPSDGAAGESVGVSGNPAVAGTFGPDGYVPASGEAGGSGVMGHAGTLGADPGCLPCGGNCCSLNGDPCGQRGAPGCGGAAGGGGGGGAGGGSSVALFVWDAHVFVSGGRLHAGSGGHAGDGGAAGSGSAGAPGAMGAAGSACYCADFPEAGCFGGETPGIPGSQGGAGGAGRDGGPGGAGAGGYAYAAYRSSMAELVIGMDTLLEFGTAGESSAGATGQAGPIGAPPN
jgi:hypothetical protein